MMVGERRVGWAIVSGTTLFFLFCFSLPASDDSPFVRSSHDDVFFCSSTYRTAAKAVSRT